MFQLKKEIKEKKERNNKRHEKRMELKTKEEKDNVGFREATKARMLALWVDTNPTSSP